MQAEEFQYYDDSMMSHGSLSIVMGTKFDIILLGKSKAVAERIWKRIVVELKRLDKMMNRFDSRSEVYFINENANEKPIEVSEEMWMVLNECGRYYSETCRLFDITLKDFSQVRFNKKNRTIQFSIPEMHIDLGGFAKGYALEKIHTVLNEEEVDQAFVDFGNSSILAIGHHPYGNSWQVSIANPFKKEEELGVFSLINNTLSTSGDSPAKSHHIINPVTQQVNEKKVVCVTSKNAVDAEVLSSVLMIASEEQRTTILTHFEAECKIFNLS